MNPKLLSDLKNKLKNKDSEEKQYDKERAVLRKRFEHIFFKELPPIINNDVWICDDELKILGFDKKGGITLWIDTTKDNRKEQDDSLDCITYDHYGNRGRLSYHNNDELRSFLDNIDIVLKQLARRS